MAGMNKMMIEKVATAIEDECPLASLTHDEALQVARSNRDAVSEDECAICGGEKWSHDAADRCPISAQFVSKREMFDRLSPDLEEPK